jgi:hypothetical protein
MQIKALLAILLISASVAFAQSKNVVTTTDRFTGFTRTEMKGFIVGPEHGFQDAFHSRGHVVMDLVVAGGEGVIMFQFETTADRLQFPDGADVHVLADGKRIDLGHFVPGRETMDAVKGLTVNEKIHAIVDERKLKLIANAKEVELKIGPYPAKLTEMNIHRLKEFLDAVSSTPLKK